MFNFLKKKEPPKSKLEEEIEIVRTDAADHAEFKYRMEHDPEFQKNIAESTAIIEADREAREKAGLTGKPGEYSFTCPICGNKCQGSWIMFDGALHGSTGCRTCDFSLVV